MRTTRLSIPGTINQYATSSGDASSNPTGRSNQELLDILGLMFVFNANFVTSSQILKWRKFIFQRR